VGKQKIYTHLVRHTGAPRHAVEKNLDVLRRIGIFPNEKKLYMDIPKDVEEKIDKKLQKENISTYIVLHPAARWKFKCWPYFDKLIKDLALKNVSIIMSASSDPIEIKMVERIIKDHPQVHNFAGKLNLKEFAYLIKKAKALITVDSLPLHMASCFQTPVVVLFGPTSEKIWGPWQHGHSRVLTSDHTCRPCSLDGCGGSKVSDCLYCIDEKQVLQALLEVTK
jgi:heptosyltransferase-3